MFDEEDDDFLIEEATSKTLLKPIIEFFKTHTCYEMMPSSNKVVVFDIDTQVKEAFRFAAEERKKKTIFILKIYNLQFCGMDKQNLFVEF
jgi:hypothetical protein